MKGDRLARVLRGMQEEGFQQILVTQTESIYYLTGLWIKPGERMLALRIAQDGQFTLYANRLFALSGQAPDLPLVEFDDTDDAVKVLAEGVQTGQLGIDKQWPSGFLLRLLKERPDLRPTPGSGPVDRARMLKDEEELTVMRRATRLNDRAVGMLPATLRENQTERDVARRFVESGVSLGASGPSFDPLVCFGANCAEPHHATDSTALKKGDSVILDLGLELEHRMSDMTRTVFYGGATDEQKKVYDLVLRANQAGKAAVRPGVMLSEIDRAARRVIEEAGYGPRFIHRTGHGIGLSVHEPPDVSATNSLRAEPGMVFSIEPGIYLPGKFGVRIEDLVCVTEDGCEVLNDLDRSLTIIQ